MRLLFESPLLIACFIGNIKKYNLLVKGKRAVLLMHLSWILIIIGAGVTIHSVNSFGSVFLSEKTLNTTNLSNQTILLLSSLSIFI